MITLEREYRLFQEMLPDLMSRAAGKYVVIHDAEIARICDTHKAALDWAYDTFGLDRFFVKEITEEKPVMHFHR
jgi:hypothetical protein